MTKLFLTLLFVSSSSFAAEQDPIAKAKLAITEGEIVLNLINQRTPTDSKIDVICLRLGRFSAILKRIAGSNPLPPEETTKHYRNYESFCGWDSFLSAPRGNIETLRSVLSADVPSLQVYVSKPTVK